MQQDMLVSPLGDQFLALPNDWRDLLQNFIGSSIYDSLCQYIDQARAAGTPIYPHQVFYALHLTPADSVKVVILGQDPYHGIDRVTGHAQAHGLAFSVPPGARPPPSLRNIFKELATDLGISVPAHGNLTSWAQQGVLLLNTVLTVVAENPGSHARLFARNKNLNGTWETCTDELLQQLAHYHAQQQRKLVVMLWGSHAQAKAHLFASHIVLQAPHPSPLSAHRGFLGCHHFSQANQALIAQGQAPINWDLPDKGDNV